MFHCSLDVGAEWVIISTKTTHMLTARQYVMANKMVKED